MALAYLSFGSNIGDKIKNIENGILEIKASELGEVLRSSKFYKTEPIDCPKGSEEFINYSIELMTYLEPDELLNKLKEIEEVAGRKKDRDKNSPRILDIDILLYDSHVINSEQLIIPHPEILKRLFIIQPLMDIKPNLFHPVLKKSIQEIFESLPNDIKKQKVIPV